MNRKRTKPTRPVERASDCHVLRLYVAGLTNLVTNAVKYGASELRVTRS